MGLGIFKHASVLDKGVVVDNAHAVIILQIQNLPILLGGFFDADDPAGGQDFLLQRVLNIGVDGTLRNGHIQIPNHIAEEVVDVQYQGPVINVAQAQQMIHLAARGEGGDFGQLLIDGELFKGKYTGDGQGMSGVGNRMDTGKISDIQIYTVVIQRLQNHHALALDALDIALGV